MTMAMTARKLLAAHRGRLSPIVLAAALGCGPHAGSSDDQPSGSGSTSAGPSEVSWVIGEFTMLRSEAVGQFMSLEIPEEGRAVATRYDCDLNGGSAQPAVVSEMQWRAVSDSLIEFVPPAPGEKIEYAGDRTPDLFIERPPAGDGITVYRSDKNEEWPRYGDFVRGRPCGYFEGSRTCNETFYVRLCPEG